jgi:predicted enzyme related to lactoylglutathione lyase
MAHPVTWFQISAREHGPLQQFYQDVFDWKMSPSPDGSPMAMVQPDKGGIPGGIAASQDGNSNVTVYINVDDLGGHLVKIEGSGGRVAMPPMELPGGMGHIAGFVDPAGNWVGLWQPGKKPAAPRAAAAKKKKPAPKRKAAAPKRPAKSAKKKGKRR